MRVLAADLVRQLTVTTGTGNIALTPLGGWIGFAQRYVNGDRVPYSVFDANGNKETGLGTYLGGNVLARTTVHNTLIAGTWSNSGTPISLSGSAIVAAVLNEHLLQQFLKLELALIAVNTTLQDGFSYGVQASTITLTLPLTPQVNDRIEIFQAAASLTGVVVDPNGSKLNGVAGTMTIDVPEFTLALVYVSAAYGWKVEA